MVNHLHTESSPYLKQHAHNPVDWYPYTPEAFKKAKKEDKLIFLSIGYSACHWCHVMAHESFEKKDIAEILNKNFISIKVDREERPDVDSIYQTFAQITGKNGGWPLSVFLTPEGNPYFVGTYFPVTSRYGIISFPQLLKKLLDVFKTQPEDVRKAGDEILEILNHVGEYRGGKTPKQVNIKELVSENNDPNAIFGGILDRFSDSMDFKDGGFGGAPKFPNFSSLLFLMRQISEEYLHPTNPEDREDTIALATGVKIALNKMMNGGIYDQIAGGFHRYSVDAQWVVPHFEKMLYDNAMALRVYSEAYLLFGDKNYKRIVREITEWLQREMLTPDGGYIATLDADSEGREGTYYIWTKSELQSILSPEEQDLCFQLYNVSDRGNFEHKTNILTVKTSISELSAHYKESEEKTLGRIDKIKFILLKHRETRVYPHQDTKIITSWNSLLLDGFFAASRIFTDSEYKSKIQIIIQSLSQFLTSKMTNPDTHRVSRIYVNKQVKIVGNLDDYAYLIQALIQDYLIGGDPSQYSRLEGLFRTVMEEFWDEKSMSFYYSPLSSQDVPIRAKIEYDMPLPSPTFVMILNMFLWGEISGDSEALDKVHHMINQYFPKLSKHSNAGATFFLLLHQYIYGNQEVVVFAPQESQKEVSEKLYTIMANFYIPRLLLMPINSSSGKNRLAESKRESVHYSSIPKFSLFICQNRVCTPGVSKLDNIQAVFRSNFLPRNSLK
ncbi:MAG: thioredoxin domain-containing protein [Promethearchaeota archaeon]